MTRSIPDLSWRAALRIALSNLPFIVAATGIHVVPSFLKVLVVGSVLFLAPGLAWADRRDGDGFVILFRAVCLSLAAAVASWLLLTPLPGPTSRGGFLLLLAAFTNAGLLLGFRRGWFAASPLTSPLSRLLMVVAAVFFVQSYVGAAYRIPALEDHDMETQGTAYGLIHALSPDMLTNRGTTFFFAHPLLLHFWIGESALVSDDLGLLRYYYESAREVRGSTSGAMRARWEADFARFQKEPLLLPTRTPNLFLGVFVILPLGILAYRITGSQPAAVGTAVLYATLPEVYLRSAYGGYMAVTNFLMLSTAYFYLERSGLLGGAKERPPSARTARRRTVVAAFLGAWANQKAVLIPMAAAAHAIIVRLLDSHLWTARHRVRSEPAVVAASLVVAGFTLGWAAFAVYGISLSRQDFVADHVVRHVVERLRLENIHFATVPLGGGKYPSIVALWKQFADHTGWLVVFAAMLGAAGAARRLRSAEGFLLLWTVIGGVGFSLVDWRQTKHLSLILPPLVLLVGVFWASVRGRARTVLTSALCAAIIWNVWRIGQLMLDFSYLKPLRMW